MCRWPSPRLLFPVCAAGSVQEPVAPQEPGAEELSRTLQLEDVVQEAASEWQALAGVF